MLQSKIDYDIVNRFIPRPLEENTFSMVDAILNGHCDESIRIYNDLIVQNQNSVVICGSLATQFRFIYQVLHLKNQGYSNDEIANELNTKSGRIFMTLKKSYGHDEDDILLILSELAEIDEALKIKKEEGELKLELFFIKRRC